MLFIPKLFKRLVLKEQPLPFHLALTNNFNFDIWINFNYLSKIFLLFCVFKQKEYLVYVYKDLMSFLNLGRILTNFKKNVNSQLDYQNVFPKLMLEFQALNLFSDDFSPKVR